MLFRSLQPLVGSSLSLATISAVILNLLFRIGIARSATLSLMPGRDDSEQIYRFMDQRGRTWGARGEVIYKATAALNEFFEAAAEGGLTDGEIAVTARFDEFNLDLQIDYRGEALELPSVRPGTGELLSDAKAPRRLSGYLIRGLADRATVTATRDR